MAARRKAKGTRNKLWQTGGSELHPMVESYTVADDYVTDTMLVPYDVVSSIAHAEMLKKIKVLDSKELALVKKGLRKIESEWKKGKFKVEKHQEDSHTAIEQYLVAHYGSVGKKIHTGRSRNDQALAMTRLYMKERAAAIDAAVQKLVLALRKRAKSTDALMPGYTHHQKAMPTTVKRWLTSYADAFEDAHLLLKASRKIIDQNPLGSASGFGIHNFPVDRAFTARKLGFSKVQRNTMYCGMSRGLFEAIVLSSLRNIMLIAGKFANDMSLFTMQEFDFFSLPDTFTTGSSIMPQKRNYDLFEVMRANGKLFLGYEIQIAGIVSSTGSGYHRDLQFTKRPFVEAIQICAATVDLLVEIVPKLRVHKADLDRAMTNDLFATEEVYKLVKKGKSFRDAYREVKRDLEK